MSVVPGTWRFNSRTPGGVRRLHSASAIHTVVVSIHAPREGCDDGREYNGAWYPVSIHAPREGCDFRWEYLPCKRHGFNSRTPGGVRQSITDDPEGPRMFQFTHPGRGATGGQIYQPRFVCVSIHAPREGCDLPPLQSPPNLSCFNSPTPGGVRLPPSSHLCKQ